MPYLCVSPWESRPSPNPYIDYVGGGSAIEWTDVLDKILAIDFDTVIPGPGPPSNPAGIVKWRVDFVTTHDHVVNDFRWPAGGLAIGQVDAFIAEMRR